MFLRVQLSQPYAATGHTSAFVCRIFVEIGTLWLFHIFCSDATIACAPFNLVRNSVAHSPPSVIGDEWVSEWVCSTLCCRSPLPWSCWRWWVGCICGWLGVGNPPTPVVLPTNWQTGWCQQCNKGSWSFARQFVVHLEIHRGSPSTPSPLKCWTSTKKGHNLVGACYSIHISCMVLSTPGYIS